MPQSSNITPIKATKPADTRGFMKRVADSLTGLVAGLGTEKDKLATAQYTMAKVS